MKSRDLLDQETTSVEFISENSSLDSLRQKAEFDEAVMSNMSEGLYTVDENGLVSYMNPAAERLFGWTLEEIRGKKMHDVTHYKHRDGTAFPASACAGLKVLTEGNELRDFEDVFIKKDGSFFDVMYSSSPIKRDGRISGLIVVFRDITEIKKSQLALKESEEKSRLFIEYSPVAMAMFDKEMRYISVSQRWMKEYDLEGDVIGKRHYELFPNILEQWKAVHSRCMAGAIERSDEDYYEKDDGTPVWLKWEVYPWYNVINEIGGIVIFTENITERKEAERTIKESEERFRTMANEAPLFVWVTDENLQTIYLNKAGLDYFDLNETVKMEDISWKKFIHPGDIENVLSVMTGAAQNNRSYTLEMRLMNCRTSEYRWFLDKGAPRYSNEKFTGFVGTTLDIHDRKEIEKELEDKVKERTNELQLKNEELQATKSFLEQLIDSSVEFISVLDKDLRFITANKMYERTVGLSRKDVQGKHFFEINPKAEGTIQHESILKALKGETIYLDKREAVLKPELYVDTYFVPLVIHHEVEGIIIMSRDVTEIVQSEQELENKNRLLNEAQHIAQLGSWEWDLETNEVLWSDEMYNIYGYENERFPVTLAKAMERMSPKDAGIAGERVKLQIEEALENYKSSRTLQYDNSPTEYEILLPGGTKKILRGMGKTILSPEGKVAKIVGTVQDVTENIRQIEELKKLSESDVQKNNFIAMASHELKTPITSIKGYVQLLLNAFDKEKQEKQLPPLLVRSSLISVDKQITRLTRLISELLDLSKIEMGTLELKKEKFSLNELAIETVEDILYTNTKHQINLFHDFQAYVFADKDRVGQVMINFLTNAIKYSPGSNKIDVMIHQTSNGLLAFSVKDYGIGIDKEEQEKIFERFYRAKGKEEQTYPGFGIGLFIANEFVAKHGGQVLVESEKGKGAVFTFTLPLFRQ